MTENIENTTPETTLEETSAEAPAETSVSNTEQVEETLTVESLLEKAITERDAVRSDYEKLQEEHQSLTERNQALLKKVEKLILKDGAVITSDDAGSNVNTSAEINTSAETYKPTIPMSFEDFRGKLFMDK